MKMDADSSGTVHRVPNRVKCEMDDKERWRSRQRS
ncbi:uncharacterized protein tra [Drosophila takahashii]|nr:uncharacterized protein LOC123003057 [Drosophila takahashii]